MDIDFYPNSKSIIIVLIFKGSTSIDKAFDDMTITIVTKDILKISTDKSCTEHHMWGSGCNNYMTFNTSTFISKFAKKKYIYILHLNIAVLIFSLKS